MDNPFERLVRSVVDYAIYMLDPQGRITSWNAGAERIKGYREEEVLGRHLSIFYTDADRRAGRAERNLEEARRHGRFSADDWRVRRDGTRFWASVVIDALHDDDGRLVGFAKITRDRTDEHRAQEARVQAEHDLHLLATELGDQIVHELDRDGIVRRVGPSIGRTEDLLGPQARYDASPIGQPFEVLYPAEDREARRPADALAQAREHGRYRGEGWRLRAGGDRFWADEVIDAVRDETGAIDGFVLITRDATGRHEAERQLEASRAQLRQAQKLEAIGQLTGGIVHDFNNLLTGVIGSLELLRRRVQAGRLDELERFLGAAETSAQRAAALTHRLLAFARRQSPAIGAVDVNALVRDMAELFHRTLGKQIRFEMGLDDRCGPALTDRNQLETALLNLVINARDAMPDGGVVRIESALVDVPAGPIDACPPVAGGRYVRLSVVDDGCGMPPQVLEQATEPFFTTKPAGQGTGLGLSMIHGFMRQIGGFVRLDSEVGVGTRAHLHLPCASRDEAEQASDPQAAPIGQGEVVLVVEDEAAVRVLITEVLTELNYRFIEADNARSALAVLQAPATRIDLLISDLALPGIGGRRLAELGRRARADLKVLFITGYEGTGQPADEPLPAGMALLRKPFALSDLGLRIRSLLAPSGA